MSTSQRNSAWRETVNRATLLRAAISSLESTLAIIRIIASTTPEPEVSWRCRELMGQLETATTRTMDELAVAKRHEAEKAKDL